MDARIKSGHDVAGKPAFKFQAHSTLATAPHMRHTTEP